MRVTICEFGPRDGEIIDIPDGTTQYRFPKSTPVVAVWQSIDPPYETRQVDDSIRTRRNPRFNDPFDLPCVPTVEFEDYSVQRYARPQDHSTQFALVSPGFFAWMLSQGFRRP
jgi:hypothetical protein